MPTKMLCSTAMTSRSGLLDELLMEGPSLVRLSEPGSDGESDRGALGYRTGPRAAPRSGW
jgi:hypothetical protein